MYFIMLLGKVYNQGFILVEPEPLPWFSLELNYFRTGSLLTLRYECSETLFQAKPLHQVQHAFRRKHSQFVTLSDTSDKINHEVQTIKVKFLQV